MSATVAIEPYPPRVADAERTTRPVVGADHSARRPAAREAAAGRLVWRTHDTPPVRLPDDAGPEATAPAQRAA